MRECGHATPARLEDGADLHRTETRRAGHDVVRRICVRVGQRHTLTRSQTIRAVTLLAVLPVKPLSRRRECAVRGGDLAWS